MKLSRDNFYIDRGTKTGFKNICISCQKQKNRDRQKPIIYKITHLKSNKIYIGQTITPLGKRISKHFSDAKIEATYPLHVEIKKEKFNKDAFVWTILEETTKAELDICEQKWIKYFTEQCNTLFNLETGGRTGYIVSDSTREKMRLAKKEYKLTKEQIEKGKQTKIANGTWGLSRPVSEDTKKKISEANKGKDGQKGSANGMAILNEEIAREIILLLLKKVKPKEIESITGVNTKLISAINNRRSWRHVTVAGYEDMEIYYQIRKRHP